MLTTFHFLTKIPKGIKYWFDNNTCIFLKLFCVSVGIRFELVVLEMTEIPKMHSLFLVTYPRSFSSYNQG